jgi:hypothetical protein
LLEAESSHLKQWSKHLLALTTVVLSLVVNFVRGSKKQPSIVEITKCSEMDLIILTTFVFFMFLLSFGGLLINKKE